MVKGKRCSPLTYKDIFTYTSKGVRVQKVPANMARGFSFTTFSEEDGVLETFEKILQAK